MISVMGAGAFGTALAVSLAQNGGVHLMARDADEAAEMQATRENARRLPGVHLPDAVHVSAEISEADVVLLAIPTQALRGFLSGHKAALQGKSLVACCKGVEMSTGQTPVQIIEDVVPGAVAAILTGPSFAFDIARGLPTALTLACADEKAGASLQAQLSTQSLRLYRTTDVVGASLGGALKNVIAIGCGAVMGAGLGESARAALLTRGFAELARLAVAQGARAETLAGLSGFGDLTLTCTSDQSRNYRFGQSLGRGEAFDQNTTVEGSKTALAVRKQARAMGLEMPLTDVIAGLVSEELQVGAAIDMLLSRPLKEE